MKEIYLDNAATTKMSRQAVKAMLPFLDKRYANPSSNHFMGLEARKAIDDARKEIAEEIGAKKEEIIFTSTGTEANALALLGAARASQKRKIVISAVEHSSIYENAQILKREGFDVVEIPVSEKKGLDFEALRREVDEKTAIVSIMHANSETGIINDVAKIGKICKDKGAIFHTDALQTFGKIRLQAKNIGIDLLSGASHKIGGSKGAAFLYARHGLHIVSIYGGGGQEQGKRSGTQNAAAIASFAAAIKEARKIDWERIRKMKQYLEIELKEIGGRITGEGLIRLPTHTHVAFRGISGDELVNYLSSKGICCSTGSACDSMKKESRIIANLGIPSDHAKGTIRFSLGSDTSKRELDEAIKEIKAFLNRFKHQKA